MIPPGLFVTGTDTGVGKTRVAEAIVRLLSSGDPGAVGALKPIASSATRDSGGRLISPDTLALQGALGWEAPLERITPFSYPGDVAPGVAMRLEGRVVAGEELLRSTAQALDWWADRARLVVVEGVGGLLCPLSGTFTVADLAVGLDYPVVIVARRGLGTLNHTLLTVEAARRRGLRIAGVVINGAEPTANPAAEGTNADELARHLGEVPILVESPHQSGIQGLHETMRCVDWLGLARRPRLPPASLAQGPARSARRPSDSVEARCPES